MIEVIKERFSSAKHRVIVLSEKLPKLGSNAETIRLTEFFNDDLWLRVQDAEDYAVSGLLQFGNLTSEFL